MEIDDQKINKILIIEDERPMRMALADKFSRSGFQVIESFNGEDGLVDIGKLHPDIVLADLIMPKLDGLVMIQKIREEFGQYGKSLPIVVLTNLTLDMEIKNKLGRHFPIHFLIKSDLRIDKIVDEVKNFLKETASKSSF